MPKDDLENFYNENLSSEKSFSKLNWQSLLLWGGIGVAGSGLLALAAYYSVPSVFASLAMGTIGFASRFGSNENTNLYNNPSHSETSQSTIIWNEGYQAMVQHQDFMESIKDYIKEEEKDALSLTEFEELPVNDKQNEDKRTFVQRDFLTTNSSTIFSSNTTTTSVTNETTTTIPSTTIAPTTSTPTTVTLTTITPTTLAQTTKTSTTTAMIPTTIQSTTAVPTTGAPTTTPTTALPTTIVATTTTSTTMLPTTVAPTTTQSTTKVQTTTVQLTTTLQTTTSSISRNVTSSLSSSSINNESSSINPSSVFKSHSTISNTTSDSTTFNQSNLGSETYSTINNSFSTTKTISTLQTSSSESCIPTNGLLAYYPFNGNANDESGNGNHGTVYGATLTTDRFWNNHMAYNFNGNGQYINCGPTIGYAKNIKTISFWAKFNSFRGEIVSKSSASSGVEVLFYSNALCFFVMGHVEGDPNIRIPLSSFNTNDWFFITATQEGEGHKIMKLYVNGILKQQGLTPSQITDATDLLIGTWNDGGRFFDGKIDDLLIYNRSLSDEEINTIFNAGVIHTTFTPTITTPITTVIPTGTTATATATTPTTQINSNIEPVTLYFNDFQDGIVGTEWSVSSIDKTPVGNELFLGRFKNSDSVRLSLYKLSIHSRIQIAFDLYIIKSWDGNDRECGPDRWSLSVDGKENLLDTTFANCQCFSQSFPYNYPTGNKRAGKGAIAFNTLGYPEGCGCGGFSDTVYHLEYTFPHTENAIVFNFASNGLGDSLEDESWGIDNVFVTTNPEEDKPKHLTPGAIAGIVVGCTAGGVLCGACGFFAVKRSRNAWRARQEQDITLVAAPASHDKEKQEKREDCTQIVLLTSDIPNHFKDPITLEIMQDPVMTVDGHTYERASIEKWFKEGHYTSPLTGERLNNLTLIPNYNMKRAIERFFKENITAMNLNTKYRY